MAGRRTPKSLAERGAAALTPHLRLAGMVLLAALPILAAASLVPHAAVLPALSLAAMAAAAGMAAIAWWRKAPRYVAAVTLWDFAGTFVPIGCAAAMLTQNDTLLEVFGPPRTN